MATNMWTTLSPAASSNMEDITCAVQSYISPENPGISTQQTWQQVYNLFSSTMVLFNSGNPNGVLAGFTYQFCWDSLNSIMYVCSTTGTISTAIWSKVVPSSEAPFNVINTSVDMVSGSTYQANNSSLVILTLPLTSKLGDRINITGFGLGGWTIQQNSGQNIQIGNTSSTIGVGGSVSSTNRYDGIQLCCTVANNTWQTISSPQGSLSIV